MQEDWSYPVKVEYKRLNPLAVLPTKALETDAGYDIYSIENITIHPGSRVNVHAGLAISVPPGWYITIEGRSGMYMRGIYPVQAIIDASYTGEMRVVLMNSSTTPYEVKIGDRIAQMIIHKSESMFNFVEVNEFSEQYSLRGPKGFGSSGR